MAFLRSFTSYLHRRSSFWRRLAGRCCCFRLAAMGCTQSKIENEEAVTRCKDRKAFMKQAVSERNAFAAAHAAYTMALKNTGAALSDFAHGEAYDPRPASAPPPLPTEKLPPPPPLPPDYAASNLLRSASMPDIPMPKLDPKPSETIPEEEYPEDGSGHDKGAHSDQPTMPPPPPQSTTPVPPMPVPNAGTWDFFHISQEEIEGHSIGEEPQEPHDVYGNGEVERHDDFRRHVKGASSSESVTWNIESTRFREVPGNDVEFSIAAAKSMKKSMQTNSMQQHLIGSESRRAKMNPSNVNLLQVLRDLDDLFLKASESAQEVTKMLEANKLYYHSNFADNRGYIDHSARVLKVITWNKSFKNMPNAEEEKDDLDDDQYETHATILDKLLAWEKKLYDEVKAGELMKLEYQRKVASLNKRKKHGSNPEAIEKAKATVSHLHTRYIVDMQSMDSTVSEIQRLRDEHLYVKLVALVDGMAKMWGTMSKQHGNQLKICESLRVLDISNAPKETTDQHHEQTVQLHRVAMEWHMQFEKLMTHQKAYIQALNSWLKINLIPIESTLREKVSSPPHVSNPPIQALLHFWNEQIEKLPVELAMTALSSFAAVLSSIVHHQDEERKQKEKCDELRKEYTRKSRAFDDWHQKYMEKQASAEGMQDSDRPEGSSSNDPVSERQFVVEALKKRMEDEVEAHQKLCRQVREKSLMSLKTHLPELFRAMADFSSVSSKAYERLQDVSQAENVEEDAD